MCRKNKLKNVEKRLAAKYRCNVPVDSAGVMFNMIELTPDKK